MYQQHYCWRCEPRVETSTIVFEQYLPTEIASFYVVFYANNSPGLQTLQMLNLFFFFFLFLFDFLFLFSLI